MTNYEVTITPKLTVYAGAWKSGEYTIEVTAKDRASAIKRARQHRIDEGDDVPATYRAKVKN